MKIKIEKLILTIGKQEVPLTLDEARQLREEMNRLFDEKVIVKEREVWPYLFPYTNPQPIYPVVTYANTTGTYAEDDK